MRETMGEICSTRGAKNKQINLAWIEKLHI